MDLEKMPTGKGYTRRELQAQWPGVFTPRRLADWLKKGYGPKPLLLPSGYVYPEKEILEFLETLTDKAATEKLIEARANSFAHLPAARAKAAANRKKAKTAS